MKKYMMRAVLFGWIVLLGMLPQLALAQGPGDEFPEGDPDVPIDGGVSLLVAAGVGYGIKKYRDQRKKTTSHF
jgi:hypothetical protein